MSSSATRSSTDAASPPGIGLIGLKSSGPHSNGYSLIRRIITDQAQMPAGELLESLLAPTRIYVRSIHAVLAKMRMPAWRTSPAAASSKTCRGCSRATRSRRVIDLDSWQRPAVFGWLAQAGNVVETEMLRTFNCGIGFVLCVAPDDVAEAMQTLEAAGEAPTLIGEIVPAGERKLALGPTAAERRLLVSARLTVPQGRGNVTPRCP